MLKLNPPLNWLLAGVAICLFISLAVGSTKAARLAADLTQGDASNVSNSKSMHAVAPYPDAVLPAKFLAKLQDAPAPEKDNPQTVATAAAGEPFPFSHKKHAAMKADCSFCHEQSQTGLRAGFPAAAKCMACHTQIAKDSEQIKKLAALPSDTRIVPEKPLYKLPDFVYFSHARHKAGGIDCAGCHGNIWESDVVELHLPMRMKACVDCHKANQAPATCTTCHEAFQQ